jgi:hypothetical protein
MTEQDKPIESVASTESRSRADVPNSVVKKDNPCEIETGREGRGAADLADDRPIENRGNANTVPDEDIDDGGVLCI